MCKETDIEYLINVFWFANKVCGSHTKYEYQITPVNIIFVTWNLTYVSHIFFHAECKYVITITVLPTVLCDRIF